MSEGKDQKHDPKSGWNDGQNSGHQQSCFQSRQNQRVCGQNQQGDGNNNKGNGVSNIINIWIKRNKPNIKKRSMADFCTLRNIKNGDCYVKNAPHCRLYRRLNIHVSAEVGNNKCHEYTHQK